MRSSQHGALRRNAQNAARRRGVSLTSVDQHASAGYHRRRGRKRPRGDILVVLAMVAVDLLCVAAGAFIAQHSLWSGGRLLAGGVAGLALVAS